MSAKKQIPSGSASAPGSRTRKPKKTSGAAGGKQTAAENQQLFHTVFQGSPSAMVLSRLSDGCFVEVNAAFLRLTGYKAHEVIGLTSSQAGITSDPKMREKRLAAPKTSGELPSFDVDVIPKSGGRRKGLATVQTISLGQEQFALSTFIDITERQHAELQLAQMKRLYTTLSQVNQTIVRVHERDELFQSICNLALEVGGFSLAWIGLLDEVSGDVRPVAASGLELASWPFAIPNIHNSDTKNGLAATALRTCRVVTSEDVLTDERTRLSREIIEQFSYHSSAAVPFGPAGKSTGVLGLVSPEEGLFKAEEEVRLLIEMGLDISFALDRLDAEAMRRQAEEAVVIGRSKLEAALESMMDAIFISDIDGNFIDFNQAFATFHKFRNKDECAKTLAEYPGFLEVFMANGELAPLDQWAVPRALRGERCSNVEYSLRRKDTGEAWIGSYSFAPIYQEGLIVGSVVTGRDITERKRAEGQLAEMKRLYATLSQVNQTIVRVGEPGELFQSICDVAVKFGEFTLAWIGLLEEASGEIRPVAANGADLTRWPFQIVNMRKGQKKDGLAATAIRTGKVTTSEEHGFDKVTRAIQKKIEEYGYRSSAAVPIRKGGKAIGMLHLVSHESGLFKAENEVRLLEEMGMDISFALDRITADVEHKKTEMAREQLARIVDASEDAILGKTLEGVITSWNHGAERLYGYSAEEALGRPVSLLMPRERQSEMGDIIARIRHGEHIEHHETVRQRKDGNQLWASITVSPIRDEAGTIVGASTIARDISERRRAEELLQASQRTLSVFVEFAPAAIAMFDRDMKYLAASRRYLADYRLGNQDVVGRSHYEIFPEIPERWKEIHRRCLAGATESADEDPFPREDGSMDWVRWEIHPWHEHAGEIGGIMLFSEVITERKKAAETIRESERQMNALVTSLDDIVFEFDEQGKYLNAWAADESLMARPRAQLLGHTINEILGETEGKPFMEAVRRVIARGQPESIEYALDVQSGQRWFLARINPIMAQDYSVQSASMLIRDITEHKRAGEKIVTQLERLNSLREIDTVISSSFDMKFSLEAIISRTVKELGADAADILVFEAGSETLEYQAGLGFHTALSKNYQIRIGEGLAGRCLLERKPVHYTDLRQHADLIARKGLLGEEKFIGYYCVPLINKRELKGVIEIFQRTPLEPDHEWVDFLQTLAGQAAIAIESASLFEGLQRSNLELALAYDETIEGWSRALDMRDKETEGHTQRVTELTTQLARAAGFTGSELQHIRRGALLHDIGKLGVPDEILLKPGPLTNEEWAIMRKHPQFAYDLIFPILYLKPALDIPYCHHEKWDGRGYPRGLQGEYIPLAARLFAVVDVWDALRHDRPYRKSWPAEKVLEHIRSLSGNHFDPQCVERFLQIIGEQAAIIR